MKDFPLWAPLQEVGVRTEQPEHATDGRNDAPGLGRLRGRRDGHQGPEILSIVRRAPGIHLPEHLSYPFGHAEGHPPPRCEQMRLLAIESQGATLVGMENRRDHGEELLHFVPWVF